MTSNNETVSGQKIRSRAELTILWSSEVKHTPIYQNIPQNESMSWLVSDFIRLNHCLLQSYLQKERWFVQDLLWWWRRGQGRLRWFCPVLPRKLPSCRLPFLFLSPLIANGTNYFCLTNHIQWEADHWLLRENQRHFMELKLRERIF